MTETASGYLDLHLEVARYFQRPEVEEMSKALRLLYNHPPKVAYLMLHTHPADSFPFATVEEWNEWGREVDEGYTQGMVMYNDEDDKRKVVYSIKATWGKSLPNFPTNYPPPEMEDTVFYSILEWIDELVEAEGIKKVIVPNLHMGGGYNPQKKEIIVPGGVSKGYHLYSYLHSYITTLYQEDVFELDREEISEYHAVINTCIYKLFKDRGYDTGEYGLATILSCIDTFDRYLEIEERIEDLLDYF